MKPATKKRPRKKQNQRKEADRLFSLFVRREGICTACDSPDNLQAAHLVSRRYLSVRYDPQNCVPLCRACHLYYTLRPLEWDEWCEARLGPEAWRELKKQALVPCRPDYPTILKELRANLEKP